MHVCMCRLCTRDFAKFATAFTAQLLCMKLHAKRGVSRLKTSQFHAVNTALGRGVGGWGGGRSSVVRPSEFKSKDSGFDPLVTGAGWGTVVFCVYPSESTLVQTCLCLTPPPLSPLFICTERTHMCAHLKDPISVCRKRVGLTAGRMETLQTGGKKLGIAPYYGCSLSPRKAVRISRALGQESCLI